MARKKVEPAVTVTAEDFVGALGLPARFEDKIMPEPNSGCWIWIGALNEHGYGKVFFKGRTARAHRVVYELVGHQLRPLLDHKCRVRQCVNPDHVEPVTNAENIRRGIAAALNGARQRSKTHCPQGHAYAGDNLIVTKSGERLCRACVLAKHQRYRRRRQSGEFVEA